jgi:hypothetical protein
MSISVEIAPNITNSGVNTNARNGRIFLNPQTPHLIASKRTCDDIVTGPVSTPAGKTLNVRPPP